ncbi:MAG: PEP-CTERM sorting domain-containing protein [Rhodocyclaceae bacterium]|nr:MAG: PEP-CTERM sorting domain-containing protein [Rhodocyclaceae bacterium]
MKKTLGILAPFFAAAGLLAFQSPAFAQRGTTVGLGHLGGGHSYATGLNASGQAVGYSTDGNGLYRAFLWSNGVMQDLGTLGGNASTTAFALNASGQVVGWSYLSGNNYRHAFLWSNGVMQDLGILDNHFTGSSGAYAINASGQVAGWSSNPGTNTRAFLWSSSAGMQNLGTLAGTSGSDSYALAINTGGQVAGHSFSSSGYYRAFLWTSGVGMGSLGTLGGNASYARALNDAGQVAGYSQTGSGDTHAFLWSSSTGMRDLGTLGGITSYAHALNATGQVAGQSNIAGGFSRAFLWNAGVMHDLNSLAPTGWTFTEATALNDLAQVAGTGIHNGNQEAFRLTLHPDWQGGNGYWSSAANWNFAGMGSFGITPGAPHDVAINPVASATVYGPSNVTVNSLAVSGNGGNLVTLNLNGGSVTTHAGTTLGANGIVTGNGRLAGALEVQGGGRVRLQNSEQMQLAGAVTLHAGGRIDAQSVSGRPNLEIGGTLLAADGSYVNLNNADVYVAGSTLNAGRISMTGYSTLAGPLANLSSGQLNVSGVAAEAVLWDDFLNNGSVNVTAGSTATFFGLVSGTGSFLGEGTKHFAGGMAPGMSPGLMTLGGNILFSGGALTMELGGTTPGSGHDKIVFLPGSTVTLAGIALNVEYWGGWTAGAGQSYDLFDWSGLSGSFSSVALPALASGLAWNTSGLYTTGEISVAAVPEPSVYLMFLAGLGLLGFAARRRSQA